MLKNEIPTPMTSIQENIILNLDIYANAVLASFSASGHGKSWEPYVCFSCHDGIITKLTVRSYQGGDRETFTGTEESINNQLEKHIINILPVLLMGSTNSNPLVVSLIGDNSNKAAEQFNYYMDTKTRPVSELVVSHNVFLPAFYDGRTELCTTYGEATICEYPYTDIKDVIPVTE